MRLPTRETRHGSLSAFWGRGAFATDPFCPGVWVGARGEPGERGEPPSVTAGSGPAPAVVERCLAPRLGSTVDAKLGLGCGFLSSRSDETLGEPPFEGVLPCREERWCLGSLRQTHGTALRDAVRHAPVPTQD